MSLRITYRIITYRIINICGLESKMWDYKFGNPVLDRHKILGFPYRITMSIGYHWFLDLGELQK